VRAWLWTPAPAEQLAAVRILICVYGLVWMAAVLPGLVDLVDADRSRWHPVGVLAGFDAPPSGPAVFALLGVAFVAGAAFLVGAAGRVTGPVFAVTFLVVATYRSCWGQIFHTDDLVTVQLLILAVAPATAAWSWDARRREAPAPGAAVDGRYGFPLRLMSIVTVLTYLLAGWAKLRTSGLDWVTGTLLRDQIAQDNLVKALYGATTSPLAGPLVSHAWLFPPMAAFAVAVELGSPVALLGGWWRNVWVGAVWMFHVGILVLMTTFFPFQLTGVAYASMFPVERLLRTLAGVARR
jgi:hypothetical protein